MTTDRSACGDLRDLIAIGHGVSAPQLATSSSLDGVVDQNQSVANDTLGVGAAVDHARVLEELPEADRVG